MDFFNKCGGQSIPGIKLSITWRLQVDRPTSTSSFSYRCFSSQHGRASRRHVSRQRPADPAPRPFPSTVSTVTRINELAFRAYPPPRPRTSRGGEEPSFRKQSISALEAVPSPARDCPVIGKSSLSQTEPSPGIVDAQFASTGRYVYPALQPLHYRDPSLATIDC